MLNSISFTCGLKTITAIVFSNLDFL